MRFLSAAALCFSLLPLGILAQTKPENTVIFNDGESSRSFALVVGSSVETLEGEWHEESPLLRYTQSHPGTYLVFTKDGQLYRLDDPARIAEAERTYAPMRELASKQKALAAEQKPLADKQHALGAEQRSAATAEEHERIGMEQGAVGAQQAQIGRQQGEIGRQQGDLGRALYRQLQTMSDACLADGTCPRVPGEASRS